MERRSDPVNHPTAAFALTALILMSVGVAVTAAAQPPQLSPAPAAAPPAPGDVDLTTSRVYVFVGKTGLGHNHAVSGLLQAGRVSLGAADQAGTLVFDMRSFAADTAEARKALGLPGETDASTQQQVQANMTGPDVLDVARHPTATFQIRSALASRQQVSGRPPVYELLGGFTLHGVTRDVMIPVEVEQRGEWLRLRGMFVIKQTEFGMKPYKKLGGVVGVADELRITGDILVRATPPGGGVTQAPAGGLGQ
jgi:polyisoprenoid-binding protein YceI